MKTRNYSGTGVRENRFAKMHLLFGKLPNALACISKIFTAEQ
jgi:hypothetical protein